MDKIVETWGSVEWGWAAVWAAVLVASFLTVFKKVTRTTRVVTVFFVGGVVIIFAVVQLAIPRERWGCVLALLPAVLIFQHAVFLRLVRMPFRTRAAQCEHADGEKISLVSAGMGDRTLAPVFAAARRNTERYFSPSTLAIRYGTPAVTVALIGIVVYYLLFVASAQNNDPNIAAAKLGVAGAYVYILLYLGQRNFRHDVTSGGAMWCAVLLAVGPVLAWAASHFSHSDLQPGGAPGQLDTSSELLYFAAGMAPRHVASFVEEVIRRLWVSPTSMSTATPRTIPITQVKGITIGIAERLAEEGILDVHALANADPLRLIRNTNFDKRQIISWIDEAILISVLPEHWAALEREGFTGAIDLAWLKSSPQALAALADRTKFDDVAILSGVIDRLSGDAQLRLIWVLYQWIDQLDAQSELEPQPVPRLA